MPSVTVNVTTVTPLWTGDAWGRYTGIKPQSILGSLRFWFEVLCYASDIHVKSYKDEKVDNNGFNKEMDKAIQEAADNGGKGISIFEAQKRTLKNLGISVPSQLFGCNGWGGFIRIKEICHVSNKDLKFPEVIYKDKTDSEAEWKECNRKKIKELRQKNSNYLVLQRNLKAI